MLNETFLETGNYTETKATVTCYRDRHKCLNKKMKIHDYFKHYFLFNKPSH